ncbi:hypothetical protein COLU111180_12130 [Cohnella lubricantis]|uniref:Uncharacterized protein n=1 Tax=Cohnella lubricantis TaxID=2163172 RepID=A0A841T521_9BACL|nr:hypothetical protein [Cohnella lubricantis]MBB6675952.1 hypothetical protein [Cohnella lubricantis]MBP2117931.1 hypothetical protein [Cohnella lubricantis]
MDIFAREGHKVVFLNLNGHDDDPLEARKAGLVEGGIYTVEQTDVHPYHTNVYLKEFPNKHFNSVMFRDATDEDLGVPERLRDYNWKEAFGAAGKEVGTELNGNPVVVQFAQAVSTEPFDRADVAEIMAIDDGENDGLNWIGVFLLKDGRYALIDAGCDYTGWGCQEWGEAAVCGTLAEMVRWGLSDEQRKRLKLFLEGEARIVGESE